MRHGLSGRKFGRTSSHRQAMFANMATSLLRHEQITTTLAKAKDLRRVVEPLITRARAGDLAARRQVARIIRDDAVLKKLFDDIAPRFAKRPGGYTRVLKAGFRQGDAAPMAVIELTEKPKPAAPAKGKADKSAKAEKADAKPAKEVSKSKPEAKKSEAKDEAAESTEEAKS